MSLFLAAPALAWQGPTCLAPELECLQQQNAQLQQQASPGSHALGRKRVKVQSMVHLPSWLVGYRHVSKLKQDKAVLWQPNLCLVAGVAPLPAISSFYSSRLTHRDQGLKGSGCAAASGQHQVRCALIDRRGVGEAGGGNRSAQLFTQAWAPP